jgi:hypothetical protein
LQPVQPRFAVTYFGWRLRCQWHCCMSLFAYYYEVKSRDRLPVPTYMHICKNAVIFPRRSVTKTSHLPECFTPASARPLCPVSSALLNTFMMYVMTLLHTANACTTLTSSWRRLMTSFVDKRQSASISVSHENNEYKTYC